MKIDNSLPTLGLKFNPFPPATTGVAVVKDIWIPDSWRSGLESIYQQLSSSAGDKALALIGEYGSGKTYILQWMQENLFKKNRVQTFLFDNPGVAFYDLANLLLRQVGRYELSKGLWEALSPKLMAVTPRRLIQLNFPEWLASVKSRAQRDDVLPKLAAIIKEELLATDEEIAFQVARVIVETGDRPYFQYRDFVAGKASALVPENQEPEYFKTLIRILGKIYGASGIAFLIDEFEDVALQRKLNKKQSFEYLSTLRRLLNVTREEAFWVTLTMTPEALVETRSLDASLVQRFAQPYEIPPLTDCEAYELVKRRLNEARVEYRDDIWPFSEDALSALRPTTYSRPRPLIKVCWQAIAKAAEDNLAPPISANFIRKAEGLVYPTNKVKES
jgi:type II secretory pathway predicted ATPase ExeA